MRPAVIGKDGRTTAITKALLRSPRVSEVRCLSEGKGLTEQAIKSLLRDAEEYRPDFVFIGPEEPLQAGVADELQTKLGIRCIGPTKSLARLETSKAFTRDLVSRHGIPGSPKYQIFSNIDGMAQYLRRMEHGFVVKPDGLTGGKGVKVSGTHLKSVEEGVDYARELFRELHDHVIVEEKLDGEEFSLMSFCDGTHVVDMPAVQDHKRAGLNDEGPNTGGMGSYSCEDHKLPFLTDADVRAASAINAAIVRALYDDTGEKYKGILYGGFMLTRDGIRLLEYNARFGDPEALNVLAILKTDFAELCLNLLNEHLTSDRVEFERRATVCKYVVPEGYPDRPTRGARIDLERVPADSDRLRRFEAAVDHRDGEWYLTGSRAIAFVGIGSTLDEAEKIAEAAASDVRGPVFHRSDIGTAALVRRRRDHIKQLLGR
jgi:phosphoribosylamine--glycine ligase